MHIGLHSLGIGNGAVREIIDVVARTAESVGFHTLWSGEHVALFDDPVSRYPYAPDGRISVAPDERWLDPMITLAFAAAATSSIQLGTGILLLPEHNPVIMAKQIASLDQLCGGRFRLGIGIGWSREEFAALGVPFNDRAVRTEHQVAAMREIWRNDIASYASEYVSFTRIRVSPAPIDRNVPIIVGGNSDAALARVARWGDGWYGFNLADVQAAEERLTKLRSSCEDADRSFKDLYIAVALRTPHPNDLTTLTDLGVDELVLVDTPPDTAPEAQHWVESLATTWL